MPYTIASIRQCDGIGVAVHFSFTSDSNDVAPRVCAVTRESTAPYFAMSREEAEQLLLQLPTSLMEGETTEIVPLLAAMTGGDLRQAIWHVK